MQIDFDTLIIASSAYYEEILEEVNDIGVSEKNIINGKVFNIPLFDYKQYISLVKFPVTILSDDCWGGYVYHELCLPFTSPLVNIYWQRDSYCKFIVDPLYYFEQPLELLKEIDFRENIYPVGRIGEGDREVRLDFVHARSFKEAKRLWETRRKRINRDRIFIKLGFDATEEGRDKYLDIFSNISYPKICFYSGKTHMKDVVYLKRFEWRCNQGTRMDSISYNDYSRCMPYLFKDINILKLLNGETDYFREI